MKILGGGGGVFAIPEAYSIKRATMRKEPNKKALKIDCQYYI